MDLQVTITIYLFSLKDHLVCSYIKESKNYTKVELKLFGLIGEHPYSNIFKRKVKLRLKKNTVFTGYLKETFKVEFVRMYCIYKLRTLFKYIWNLIKIMVTNESCEPFQKWNQMNWRTLKQSIWNHTYQGLASDTRWFDDFTLTIELCCWLEPLQKLRRINWKTLIGNGWSGFNNHSDLTAAKDVLVITKKIE